jgi:hypothetical protein
MLAEMGFKTEAGTVLEIIYEKGKIVITPVPEEKK